MGKGREAPKLPKKASPSTLPTGNQPAPPQTDKLRKSSISKLLRNMKVGAQENSKELKVAASEGWRGLERAVCMCVCV